MASARCATADLRDQLGHGAIHAQRPFVRVRRQRPSHAIQEVPQCGIGREEARRVRESIPVVQFDHEALRASGPEVDVMPRRSGDPNGA
jgi:hypothetical protein